MATSSFIRRTKISKRSPVYDEQAKFFAELLLELIDEYRIETEMNNGNEIELSEFFQIAAYNRFMRGANACGFVCSDYNPDFPLGEILSRPEHEVQHLSFAKLRHYVHTLLRAEAWAGGHDSPIRDALNAGAMQILANRILNDETLREP